MSASDYAGHPGAGTRGVEKSRIVLRVSLDASGVEDREEQELKVVIRAQDGTVTSELVQLDKSGQGAADVSIEAAGALRVVVGPARASDEDLLASQTLSVNVPSRLVRENDRLELAPISIAPWFWFWWLRWCRRFVVRGRVVCPDGSPVPGANVCAYDVDWWWLWSSTQQVGCATTDANGAFTITFTWCCGFWPWWWWRRRAWSFDPGLADRISASLRDDPALRLSPATQLPSLAPFRALLAEQGTPVDEPLEDLDPGRLEQVRGRLLEHLPAAPELERLHVWPWRPWLPWWDCAPDLIFKVTQDCEKPGMLIVDEGIGDTRWNVPAVSDVTLVAGPDACCRPCHGDDCPDLECLVVTQVCGNVIAQVGGNLGAPPAPEGYARPGAVLPGVSGYDADRPFGGTVLVEKQMGAIANVDYYEIEHSTDDGATWSPLPPGAAADFNRAWMKIDPGPVFSSGPADFPVHTISGHDVYETREHWEATHFGDWSPGGNRFWLSTNYALLVPLDSTKLSEGRHRFRVRGYELVGNDLEGGDILPLCANEEDSEFVLHFDNQVVDPLSHDPSHNCGMGVHTCTLEPDTHFLDVRINGMTVGPCDTVDAKEGTVEIDVLVEDSDGHLAVWSLIATYGLNLSVDLLDSANGATITPIVPGTPYGPTYGEALGQGAVAPAWAGGSFTVALPVEKAFPVPCCYQLELRAHKRTIVSCDHSYVHRNLSEYTLGVGVCP